MTENKQNKLKCYPLFTDLESKEYWSQLAHTHS